MPEHNFTPITGRLDRIVVESSLLENRLGDPTLREVLVHIPQAGLELIDQGERLPVLIYLAPFTSSGLARAGWKAFAETLPQRHERLVSENKMLPTILVLPDCFTSLGGNQFVDSNIMGQWSSWLHQSLKPAISEQYPTNEKFALFGKSSGGYGALHNAILHPGEWQAIASHSGDVGFDILYRSDFATVATQINRHNGLDNFLNHIKQCSRLGSDDFHALMTCAMAASYDSAQESDALYGIRLPFELDTCLVDETIWGNWIRHDPLKSIEENIPSLKSLDLLYIDCGNRDQYGIQYGSRMMIKLLKQYGIDHHWEEFDGTHSGIEYRLDFSMPLLAKALHD
tara:strand:+ start:1868 stop:2890 length:1023 start_codon:yes stop_codon:yes gene_type:complete